MKRNRESGFALLLVYAMAATVAIMLYMQLPRVAFEAQREKEQLLIDRGQQYSRAVQLYVRKFQRYPADIAALESTQNIRFLRKQYTDPMTGKNEWRIIHVGPGGVFTDSQVYGKDKKKDASAPQTFITEMQQTGGNGTSTGEGVNLAMRRRPSDPAGAPGDPNNPGAQNGQNGAGTINGPVMVLPDGRIVPATNTGLPAQPNQGGAATGTPGSTPGATPIPSGLPGQPGFGGFPGQNNLAGQNGGVSGQGGLPGQGGIPGSGGPPTGAANLINQILTSPRPQPGQPSQGGAVDAFGNPTQNGGASSPLGGGGLGSNTGTPLGNGLGGQVVGGGFAGVASKYEQEGIKIYNDKSSYNQWEFVYDITKDPTRGGGQQGLPNGAQGVGQGTGQLPGSGAGTGTIPGSAK